MLRRTFPLLLIVLAGTLAGCAYRPTGWKDHAPNVAVTPPTAPVWAAGETRVFTIFCHGTGRHRLARDGEFVGSFADAYWGRGEGDATNAFYTEHYQKTFLILDGVGTTGAKDASGQPVGLATDVCPEHPMPGDFWPDTLDKPLKPAPNRVSNMTLAKTFWSAHRGDLMGDGWDDNVVHAIYVLKQLADTDQFPETINIIGWSRGAVTGLKLANAICDYFVDGRPIRVQLDYARGYPEENLTVALPARDDLLADDAVGVNLFLLDPVPGRYGGDGETFGSRRSSERFPADEADYQRLPRIVDRCIITLANDEQREGFSPLDEDDLLVLDPTRTTAIWLPFPGIHATQARFGAHEPFVVDPDGQTIELTAPPTVVWDLAWRFLATCGTTFVRPPEVGPNRDGEQLDTAAIVDLYADMWLRKEAYHAVRNRGMSNRVLGGLEPRVYTGYPFAGREYWALDPIQRDRSRGDLFTADFGVYTRCPGFFINEHHRACVAAGYPQTYALLVGEASVDDVGEDAARELSGLSPDAAFAVQLDHAGCCCDAGDIEIAADAVGEGLGEPLRLGETPLEPRFTGALGAMDLVPGGSAVEASSAP